MMPPQKVILAESMGYWNVATVDGYILASFELKSAARLYQRIIARTTWTETRAFRFLRSHLGEGCR